jgi:trehalose 6-phosphate phosphatase
VQAVPPGQTGTDTEPDPAVAELLAPLRDEPSASAILCDLDGTLAPIVSRPDDAAVPEPAREVLRDLATRYALVGIVSGRRAADARALVGIDELTYSGNHGFELLEPGTSEPSPHPALDGHEEDAERFVGGLGSEELERLGFRIEDKGAIVALHWRGAEQEGEAEARANEIASEAEWKGLIAHRGRKVLEIRPDVSIDKGVAVESLLRGRGLRAAMYGGDDRTDADAFRGLRRLLDAGELSATAAIAVASEEVPAELLAEADVRVDGTDAYLGVLRSLL